MQTITQSRTRVRAVSALAFALGLAAAGAAWSWVSAALQMPQPLTAGSSLSADAIARRAEAAFADADSEFDGAARDGSPASIVFFRGATASACAAGTRGRGAFYCPETAVAALDLGFLEALVARLRRDADLGIALVAGRLAAEHRQLETGVFDAATLDMIGARKTRRDEIRMTLALHADCITGAWAAAAAPRLGPVPAGFWSELVWSARNVSTDFAGAGRPIPPEIDTFATGAREARGAAFERGYAAASPAACAPPVKLEALSLSPDRG